jgi:hypothetical protein
MLRSADTANVLAGESCRLPQKVLTRSGREIQVGTINGFRKVSQVLKAAARSACGAVGGDDLIDVGHWDQVQVCVTAASRAKVASPRPVLGDNHRPERATDQRSHILYGLANQHQFSLRCIRYRVDVVKRHEQAVPGSEAADCGQQHPPGYVTDNSRLLTSARKAGELGAERAVHDYHSLALFAVIWAPNSAA